MVDKLSLEWINYISCENKNLNIFGNSKSFNVKNLLDKGYEKPATYNQDGRRIGINFKKTY